MPCFALTLIYHPNALPNYLLGFLHRVWYNVHMIIDHVNNRTLSLMARQIQESAHKHLTPHKSLRWGLSCRWNWSYGTGQYTVYAKLIVMGLHENQNHIVGYLCGESIGIHQWQPILRASLGAVKYTMQTFMLWFVPLFHLCHWDNRDHSVYGFGHWEKALHSKPSFIDWAIPIMIPGQSFHRPDASEVTMKDMRMRPNQSIKKRETYIFIGMHCMASFVKMTAVLHMAMTAGLKTFDIISFSQQ